MKSIYLTIFAAAVLSLSSCGGKSSTGTDNVVTDSIVEEGIEVVADSVAGDSVVAVEASDVVAVLTPESKVEPSGKPLVIDFSATWCGPCQKFKPVYHKVAEQMAGKADFATADVDQCEALAKKYEVSLIPMVVVIKADGTTVSNVGAMDEAEFVKFLEGAI